MTGRVLRWLVGLGLTPSRWPGTSCGTVLLEVEGRRTGRIHALLVTWVEYEGDRHLVTMPGKEPHWVKNMKAAGNTAVLRHGRRRSQVSLREVPADARAPILREWYKTTSLSPHPRRHFGLGRDAGIDDFEVLAPTHPVYRILPRVRGTGT